MKESHLRSIVKSIIWRILGIIVLAIVTYTITRSWIVTGWITFLHHFIFLFVFYIHERFYQFVTLRGIWRAISKVVSYEIILGNFILGIITLLITGDVHKMTVITLTYISIKIVMLIVYDLIWNKIRWGLK